MRFFSLLIPFCALPALAQLTAGPNVNMVSGTAWPGGDPFLQRQNEPSMAVSSRNSQHVLAGANDYRTVDLPGLPSGEPTGDAWLGVFKSFDGGQTWTSGLLDGYPQQNSSTSPLRGYQAAADPMVRPGTNGLFFLSGLAFNRGDGGTSAMFVSRFIDDNNLEGKDTIRNIGTVVVDKGDSKHFLDKGAIAVDIHRKGSIQCSIPAAPGIPAASFPAGDIYVAYTRFTGGADSVIADILMARSGDCGATWSQPRKISGGQITNQGAAIAIDPNTGTIYIAWRVFANGSDPDSIMLVSKPTGDNLQFSAPVRVATISPFDQDDTGTAFRTNALPTVAVDPAGQVYVAWSQRGLPPNGDARVVVAAGKQTGNAPVLSWSAPRAVDSSSAHGHQIMPALSSANGKLTLAWYDFRNDDLGAIYAATSTPGSYSVSFPPLLPGFTQVFGTQISDPPPYSPPPSLRHTVEVRTARAAPGYPPVFDSSISVSQYAFGSSADDLNTIRQLEFNVPNLPLFNSGTLPFIGDYIDVAGSTFIPVAGGGWRYNTLPTDPDVTRIVWTDNRNVVQPLDGDWQHYTPVGTGGGASKFDPTQQRPACTVGQTGMRNQDIYTSQISSGLVIGAKGNDKTLGGIQRQYSVTLQNPTNLTKSYRLTIPTQPSGGKASFLQFPVAGLQDPLTQIDVQMGPVSSAARSVFATSTDPNASIPVTVTEISAPGGTLTAGGLQNSVLLNSDISNPNISNPNISNVEISTPNISNPNISNPNISNPNISNPNISNPNISNYVVANPNISNPNISNPNISNPNISNPNISNPNISNPNISNTALTDVSYTVTNTGNTASSYALRLRQNQPLPGGVTVQLIVSGYYTTPVANGCSLTVEAHYLPIANVTDPAKLFSNLSDLTKPAALDPAATTFSLLPGENALVTLRVYDTTTSDPAQALQHYNPVTAVAPVAVSQSANTGSTLPAQSLLLTNPILPGAQVTIPYTQTLQVTGGFAPYTFSLLSGTLPVGMTLTPAGVLQGAPAVTGSFSFAVKISDNTGASLNANLTLLVSALLNSITLPTGFQNFAYPATVLSATGAAPFTWSTAAPLPPGMNLSAGGVLTGFPSGAGSFNLPVTVTDANGASASASLPLFLAGPSSSVSLAMVSNITVNSGPVQLTVAPGALLTVALDYSIDPYVGCPGCVDQIQIGFATGQPQGCAYNSQPGTVTAAGHGAPISLTAPAAPGRYYIAYAFTLQAGCLPNWLGTPPPQQYIAAVDVIAPVVSVGNATASAVQINGGGNTAAVSPSASYEVNMNYAVASDLTIIDQLEIGLNSQLPSACAYSGVAGPTGTSGNATLALTAPVLPGRYYISMDRSQDFSCLQTSPNWWTGAPANNYSRFIGVIDVH